MAIITVSMDEETLLLLDALRVDLGLRGRSDTVRAGLRALSAEHEKMELADGLAEGVLIVMHQEAVSAELDKSRHRHHDVIKAQMHNHLRGGRCLQTFILSGGSEEIHEFLHTLRRLRGLDYIRFIPSNMG